MRVRSVIPSVAIVWLTIIFAGFWWYREGLDVSETTGHAQGRVDFARGSGRHIANHTAARPVVTAYTGPDPEQLVHGLPPPVVNPADLKPLSSLGLEAEYAYQWGPATMTEYRHNLDKFLENHFPIDSQPRLREDLERYLGTWTVKHSKSLPVLGGTGVSREIYMTDKDDSRMSTDDVRDWVENKDGWGVFFLDDQSSETFVDRNLGSSRLKQVWDALPSGILHSDMLRYILLYLNGGIYTDLDTKPLKPISEWGQEPDLFRQGRGWLFDEDREGDPTMGELEEMKRSLGTASVIVGVESDVGDRKDWHDWWPRPLQIVQWTIASAPRHPILLDVLLGITHATSRAYTWAREHHPELNAPHSDGEPRPDITSEPKAGGPVGVMDWTGPGVWTDSVLRYLRVKYGVRWTDLTRLARPLRIGEVVILPVTGFSPGVGNFGAMSRKHPQAMVEHRFAGSWKAHEPQPEDE